MRFDEEKQQALRVYIDVIEKADDAINAATAIKKDAQAQIIGLLRAQGEFSVNVDSTRITRVEPTRLEIDSDSLKNALGARAFNKLCVQKLDPEKVRAAVKDGVLDAEVLAKHSVVKPIAPSLRMSAVQEDEDGD